MNWSKSSKLNFEPIGESRIKGQDITLYRDQHGKYHIRVNATVTQKRLSANEMARWFLNAANEEAAK